MPTVTTKDGTEIFYKSRIGFGSEQPTLKFFHHGWPLTAVDGRGGMDSQNDWPFFLSKGLRCSALSKSPIAAR